MAYALTKWLILVPVFVLGCFAWASVIVGGIWHTLKWWGARRRRRRVMSNAAEIRRLVNGHRPRV